MEQFEVTDITNFMRIFRLPLVMPEGFCFNGGHSVTFMLVDWFNPVCDPVPKMLSGESLDALKTGIRSFIKEKVYYDPKFQYIAITDYGDSFLI